MKRLGLVYTHEQPGYAAAPADAAFQAALLAWLRFHNAMLIGKSSRSSTNTCVPIPPQQRGENRTHSRR